MYVRAISVGCAVPRADFEAQVHSAFEAVLNLKQGEQGLLLTLLDAAEGDLPQGIRFDAPDDPGFRVLPIGSRATCRGGVLRLEGASLAVDLRGARRWESNLLDLQPDLRAPAVQAAWRWAWEALNRRQARNGAELKASELEAGPRAQQTTWIRQMSAGMHGLREATRRCDSGDVRWALACMIGLGPGLTPCGDDVVAGYLIGLWCTAQGRPERRRFLAELGRAVVGLANGTNDISRTYLCHAAHGQASSRLVELAVAICAGDDEAEVLRRAEAAMEVGHTSGMDGVTGLLCGLEAWQE